MRRRDLLHVIAAFIADRILRHRIFARRVGDSQNPKQRAIIATFGGGVRYQDRLPPEDWRNIPHLAEDLVPQGFLYTAALNQGITTC